MNDWIAILPTPLDVSAAVSFVQDGAAGGIDVFLGTTRDEAHHDGRALLALDYEAYEEMALAQMKRLADEARGRWPVSKIALLHRIGRVEIAQPSVIVAVSTPHRAQSFEACRYLIDQLKTDVPIWKKEVWSDGSGTWVHP
jgi:molybdopterin synthase catalytic subunit